MNFLLLGILVTAPFLQLVDAVCDYANYDELTNGVIEDDAVPGQPSGISISVNGIVDEFYILKGQPQEKYFEFRLVNEGVNTKIQIIPTNEFAMYFDDNSNSQTISLLRPVMRCGTELNDNIAELLIQVKDVNNRPPVFDPNYVKTYVIDTPHYGGPITCESGIKIMDGDYLNENTLTDVKIEVAPNSIKLGIKTTRNPSDESKRLEYYTAFLTFVEATEPGNYSVTVTATNKNNPTMSAFIDDIKLELKGVEPIVAEDDEYIEHEFKNVVDGKKTRLAAVNNLNAVELNLDDVGDVGFRNYFSFSSEQDTVNQRTNLFLSLARTIELDVLKKANYLVRLNVDVKDTNRKLLKKFPIALSFERIVVKAKPDKPFFSYELKAESNVPIIQIDVENPSNVPVKYAIQAAGGSKDEYLNINSNTGSITCTRNYTDIIKHAGEIDFFVVTVSGAGFDPIQLSVIIHTSNIK